MQKSTIIFMSLFLPVAYVMNLHSSPAGDTLEPVKKEIAEKFINIDSSKVAQDLKQEGHRPVSEKFQEYIEQNEKAKKVFQVYRDGTGEFSMQVINLEEDVNKKFATKTDELNNNYKSAITKEVFAKTSFATGSLMLSGAILYMALGGDKGVGFGLASGGVTANISSLFAWKRSAESQHNCKAHLEQNIIMHEKWRNQFYEAKKHRKEN